MDGCAQYGRLRFPSNGTIGPSPVDRSSSRRAERAGSIIPYRADVRTLFPFRPVERRTQRTGTPMPAHPSKRTYPHATVREHKRSPRSQARPAPRSKSRSLRHHRATSKPQPPTSRPFKARVPDQPMALQLLRAHQTRLKQLGYYAGPIDAIAGPGTIKATIDFKRRAGLRAEAA